MPLRGRFRRWDILAVIVVLILCVPGSLCCEPNANSQESRVRKNVYNGKNSLALLSGTLRTYQKANCDNEWMNLRCPQGTTISVQVAQYGRNLRVPLTCQSGPSPSHWQSGGDISNVSDTSTNSSCMWPVAVQTVVGLCQKKSSCKFSTSPKSFGGDPCPGTRKFVEVAFKCRPSEFKSVIGCEDEVIQLKCNRSSRLAIYSANYGRTEYESVQCPQPNGVPEESCLSSFATETVMQMCHGKRSCALNADPATFGTPCKPESRMYLKVIYTCVPRKVLQDKYQGEPEPDELYEPDEPEDDGPDSSVIEQPSIYSPDHSKGWPHPKNTSSPGRNSLSQGSAVRGESGERKRDSDSAWAERGLFVSSSSSVVTKHDSHVGQNGSMYGSADESNGTYPGVRIVYLISQGISAYEYISKNPEKFYMYLAMSTASALLLLILIIIVKMTLGHRKRLRRNGSKGSSGGGGGSKIGGESSKGATTSTTKILSSGLSDIDELSLDMESNEITFTELPSILKRSSPFDREHPADTLRRGESGYGSSRPLSTVTGATATTTLGRSNEVVRFSNTLGRRDKTTNNPKSLDVESNEHFFYG